MPTDGPGTTNSLHCLHDRVEKWDVGRGDISLIMIWYATIVGLSSACRSQTRCAQAIPTILTRYWQRKQSSIMKEWSSTLWQVSDMQPCNFPAISVCVSHMISRLYDGIYEKKYSWYQMGTYCVCAQINIKTRYRYFIKDKIIRLWAAYDNNNTAYTTINHIILVSKRNIPVGRMYDIVRLYLVHLSLESLLKTPTGNAYKFMTLFTVGVCRCKSIASESSALFLARWIEYFTSCFMYEQYDAWAFGQLLISLCTATSGSSNISSDQGDG